MARVQRISSCLDSRDGKGHKSGGKKKKEVAKKKKKKQKKEKRKKEKEKKKKNLKKWKHRESECYGEQGVSGEKKGSSKEET